MLDLKNPANKYQLELENFKGPFDLLFHLIEKNKMDIYDIDINEIVIQYNDYLSQMKQLDLDIASEFLVMAARLLHIKSKMLLPKKNDDEEDEDDVDPREELVIRLLEYKRYKAAANILKEKQEKWKNCIYKVPENVEYKTEYDNKPMSLSGLKKVYEKLEQRNLKKVNKKTKRMSTIVKNELYTVKNKLKEITELFRFRNFFNFNKVFNLAKRHKLDVISGFMAILELAKFHKVKIKQAKFNDDISVEKVKDLDIKDMKELIDKSEE